MKAHKDMKKMVNTEPKAKQNKSKCVHISNYNEDAARVKRL